MWWDNMSNHHIEHSAQRDWTYRSLHLRKKHDSEASPEYFALMGGSVVSFAYIYIYYRP